MRAQKRFTMKYYGILLLFILVLKCSSLVKGAAMFRLANIYADNMVLQMAPKQAHIWGWGEVGASITVHVNSHEITTAVESTSKWSLKLPPQMPGGPYLLKIVHADSEEISLDVWFGDVWVCSGQSNMEMSVSVAFNATEETNKATTYQNMRLFQLENIVSDVELDEVNGISIPWGAPTEQNVPGFSAVCIMFGERMSDSLGGRPIGLIDTTWGGTRIEAWSSTRVLTYCNTPPNAGSDQNGDHVLWNAMVNPLTRLTVRGAIWYQGESNAEWQPQYYPCHLQRLALDWKNSFIDGNIGVPAENNITFPFGVVQLGPKTEVAENAFGYLRWHQTIDQGVLPNAYMPESFMAAAYDTTDPKSPLGDNHPRDKQTVADRLAKSAKALLYNETWRMHGPTVISTVENTPGVFTLTYDMDILVRATNGFTVLNSNGSWVETSISGTSGRDVMVNVASGATHLAYAWRRVVCDYKKCAIYSADQEMLPAQVWLWNLKLNQPGF